MFTMYDVTAPICPYCGKDSKITNGRKIYPHRDDLVSLRFWICEPCDAYVGCHKANLKHKFTGIEPLGTLANKELRDLRKDTHNLFDPLWKNKIFKSRGDAYKWLADSLSISKDECHISMFDVVRCQKAIQIIKREHYEGQR